VHQSTFLINAGSVPGIRRSGFWFDIVLTLGQLVVVPRDQPAGLKDDPPRRPAARRLRIPDTLDTRRFAMSPRIFRSHRPEHLFEVGIGVFLLGILEHRGMALKHRAFKLGVPLIAIDEDCANRTAPQVGDFLTSVRITPVSSRYRSRSEGRASPVSILRRRLSHIAAFLA
jgi:hypothetical protein